MSIEKVLSCFPSYDELHWLMDQRFGLRKIRSFELEKKFKSLNKNWSQTEVACTCTVKRILKGLLKVLRSRVLGLCCRGLRFCNIRKLCDLKNKNKLCYVCCFHGTLWDNFFCLLFDFDRQRKVEAAAFVVGFSISNF